MDRNRQTVETLYLLHFYCIFLKFIPKNLGKGLQQTNHVTNSIGMFISRRVRREKYLRLFLKPFFNDK